MLSLKKVYRDELLQLALILSILRVNQDSFYENDLYGGVNNLDFDNGTSWRSLTPAVLRSHYVNPKSLDSVLLNYERDLFADLNSLGRYNRGSFRHPDVTAYLLNIERSVPLNSPEPLPVPAVQQNQTENDDNDNAAALNPVDVGINLSQEDMDLIEVLWKQDVDLGFSVENATPKLEKLDPESSAVDATTSGDLENDDLEKVKTLKAINEDKIKVEPENDIDSDPWAGLNYTIDTETGEYVIKGELDETLSGADCGSSCDLPLGDLSLPLPEFLLDEALRLVDLDDETSQDTTINLKDLENLSLGATSVKSANTSAISPSAAAEAESSSQADGVPSSPEAASVAKDTEDELSLFADMIQTPQFHHPHHRAAFQSRMPFVRTVSMEQRWQDLANLLSLPSPADSSGIHHPFSHHHPALHNYSHPHPHGMSYSAETARGVLLHNATLTPPMGDINATVPYSNLGGTNLGSAVATSMNLTNSSEPMGEPSTAPHYKLEPSHDVVYYQNGTSEMNQTDGFLSSILNDEDLQLMDMAMNEGMYTMRMLDSNNAISNLSMNGTTGATTMSRNDMERMDTSSDSAVSSMGSERVPSLSDGEWCDGGSDSGHTTAEHYVTDYQSKIRPFDYSYSSRQLNNGIGNSDSARIPPVAQKKHQMYGKRYFQDQSATSAAHTPQTPLKYEFRDAATSSYNIPNQPEGAVGPRVPEMKYSCSLEFGLQSHLARNSADHIQHNHTYHLPAESSGVMQRPISRDKSKSRKSDEEHLTRDEKRARALNVPIAVDDIINLPMDEFNERLSKYDLSEAQLSLIRDIRRRGKNKVAAQNCRKRKLDQILSLADEVKEMRDRKLKLISDHEFAVNECKRMKDKYQQLYRHVFQNLRDADGNQYSPYQYSLQTSADGSILMVPRSNSTLSNPERKDPPQNNKE
ncbi:segmentation protein cap'n'collar isoform X1 [Anoplophora glabripennis]|uniref:segmentation protein cap'n'collar isoform X1 n=2 Tax=Anoplophora glabripennis TaxID=217634 RepID=UPI000873FCE6|nr:segmentation protein cap'n'collar isoform X1 [Anoplophora glabripennis]